MSEEGPSQLATPEEALYAALSARYGLLVRGGDFSSWQKAKARLQKQDEALSALSILGPDPEGRFWLVRKDRLGG